ncbi:hypothetical protein BC939DRAFT_456610 [Gamsiella multidivaricata]|uniref:uncharacterized protein n=1 Tax=Gamsiella multidivaricata TaxID=101098 RepID=UPI0022208630|nr:uncharacterized protein BC939DRAFT_456610 [Gamsiella multidivaricata]KAG0362369.1 hypothetical protein BGZ54_008648 [Gamsiella multidivaricata]KAI7820934.1 hypothetical protein BC939DRAFT_456610 [Gamsiella multidivaricata]
MSSNQQLDTSATVTIPVIDFSLFTSDPAECARQVGEASQHIGFFYLKNHGIPQDLIDRMFECSERFFQRPLQNKSQYLIGPGNIGYTPIKSETLDPEHQTMGDLKEAYNIRKYSIKDDSTNYFVQGNKAEQEDLGVFYKDLHRLSRDIMQCFAIALQVPETSGGRHYFDKSHEWDADSGTTLRFLHYPKQSGDPNTPLAGSHTDYGSITLLMQKDIAGLEVQASRVHKDVPWVAAPVIPNTILVNIADHLQMWTNGLLKSTMHRVMYNPQQQHHSRYSIACFIHANDDTRLDPIPSPLITQEMRADAVEFEEGRNMTAGEYLDWRLARSYNYDHHLEDA